MSTSSTYKPAFDSVDRKSLWKLLRLFGVPGTSSGSLIWEDLQNRSWQTAHGCLQRESRRKAKATYSHHSCSCGP
ncbi:hypothetical protein DPMN_110692 [Dreissena polymorpha]|uniref:Uncharacterized protein n=1 Tax=Dreissena polymorpha TaxID=45954 RepID=A0A9D4KCW1_DREPO|nr:hypothetical protein DPMN_110692 [Dreissena polymorpha]